MTDGSNHMMMPMPAAMRQPTVADRLALQVGLALVAWSRRPRRSVERPREYNPRAYQERTAARTAREEHWERAMYSHRPWR